MPSPASTPRGYRFATFEVDLRAGELRKGGLRIKLQDQPFRVLEMLLERSGDVVTREEVQQRLWSADTFVDFERGVNAAIQRLREALGDSADNPRFVETLPRRGYRLIPPVEVIKEITPDVPPPPPPPPPTPVPDPRRFLAWRSWTWGVGGLLLLVIGVSSYFTGWRPWPHATPPAGKIMLAVLPFENMSGDPGQEFFSDGQTEELISQIGRLNPQRLGVIARTSAMHYKHSSKPLDQIAKELDVHYVVEGSVRRADDRVRITAKLIQVSDQTLLWTQSYERPSTDILSIQSDVAEAIADEISVRLEPRKPFRPVNPQAYEACLNGRFWWNKRSEEGLRRSVEYLQEAIRKDPQYPLAHAWLADAYQVLGYYSILPPNQASPLAKAAAKKALELDDTLAEAHAALGDIAYAYDWDWKTAEKEFTRAIALNPNYATAHQWYADYLIAMGRLEPGLVEIEKARSLDPKSLLINMDVGLTLNAARRYDQAIEQYRKTIELDPTFPLAHSWFGVPYLKESRFNEAISEFEQGAKLSGDSPVSLALLGYGYGVAGRRKDAQNVLQTLDKLSRQRYVSPVYAAVVYVGLRDNNQAFAWANRAYNERAGWLPRLKVEPMMDDIRSDPRFQNLVKRIGLVK